MSLDWSSGALAQGLACYRNREFFAAHEHWEDVWRSAVTPEKTILQGLIQIAVAFHHLERQNTVGAASLLASALAKLEGFPPYFEGIALTPICDSMRAWLAALGSGVSLEQSWRELGLPPIWSLTG